MNTTEFKKFEKLAERILCTILIAFLVILCFIVSGISIYTFVKEISHTNTFVSARCQIDKLDAGMCNLNCTRQIGNFNFQDVCPNDDDYSISFDAETGKYQVAYRMQFGKFFLLTLFALCGAIVLAVAVGLLVWISIVYVCELLVRSLARLLYKFSTMNVKIEDPTALRQKQKLY
jgi:hypothetical protein